MKNILVYVGGFGLPDYTASAQRAAGNSKLFASLGYKVIVMGKIDFARSGREPKNLNHYSEEGIEFYDIRQPDLQNKYPSYVNHIDSIEMIVDKYGREKVYALIAYNYPSRALKKLINFAQDNSIKMIAECTEWHGFDGTNIVRNLSRGWQTEYRMRYLAFKAGNIICASRHAQQYFSRCNTVALPFCIDTNDSKWEIPARSPGSTPRRYVYAGNPGMNMKKDYIHLVIDAFVEVTRLGLDFEFVVVGITREQFLKVFPVYHKKIDTLAQKVQFLGRIPHQDAIREIRQSDYFVFLRPENRVSQFGFPTKLVEAFCCGVPSITNATSDINLYIKNEVNGFLLQRPDRRELQKAICKALTIDDNHLNFMKSMCLANNPFSSENFRDEVGQFLLRAC